MLSAPPLLISCIGVDHDLDLLPHFLRHYLDLGLQPDRVRLILNSRDKNSANLRRAHEILESFDVRPAKIWIAPYTSQAMWNERWALQQQTADATDWVISADVDEFHEYPEPVQAFFARCEDLQAAVIQGPFIDRLASDGRLTCVRKSPDLFEQYPVQAEAIWSLAGKGVHHDRYGTVKLMAMKGRVAPNRGGHDPAPYQAVSYLYRLPLGRFPEIEEPSFRFRIPTRVHHFHWTAKLPEMLRARISTPGVSAAGLEYGRKQLAHFSDHNGVDLEQIKIAPEHPRQDWKSELKHIRRLGALRQPLWKAAEFADRLRGRFGQS